MRSRSFLLAAALLALGACAHDSDWRVRDARGWPVQTWAWSEVGVWPGVDRDRGDCAELRRAALVAPDSVDRRAALACGIVPDGWHARLEQDRAAHRHAAPARTARAPAPSRTVAPAPAAPAAVTRAAAPAPRARR